MKQKTPFRVFIETHWDQCSESIAKAKELAQAANVQLPASKSSVESAWYAVKNAHNTSGKTPRSQKGGAKPKTPPQPDKDRFSDAQEALLQFQEAAKRLVGVISTYEEALQASEKEKAGLETENQELRGIKVKYDKIVAEITG